MLSHASTCSFAALSAVSSREVPVSLACLRGLLVLNGAACCSQVSAEIVLDSFEDPASITRGDPDVVTDDVGELDAVRTLLIEVNFEARLDKIRIGTIPEPASGASLGAVLLLAGSRRRAQRR